MGIVRVLTGAMGLCLALAVLPACSGESGSSGMGGDGGDGGVGGDGGTGGALPSDCGDSVRDAVEACDDGNNDGGDGCSADCTMIESG